MELSVEDLWLKKDVIGRSFSYFPSRYGRKIVMLASSPILLLSCFIAIITRTIAGLYAVRLIQGISLAVAFTVTPIYLGEIAEPKLRGQLGTYFQVFWYIGMVYSYATGPYVEYETYLYLACIQPVLFIICFTFVPESPYYLLMVKKEEEAFKVLSWLRAGEDISLEYANIKESVDEEMKNKGSWKDLVATKKDRMALLIVELAGTVKYLNGIGPIVLYATQTFVESSPLDLSADQMTLFIPIIIIITTWMASFMADSVGRKPLLIISTVGSAIFHTIVAVYYYLEKETHMDVSSYMWTSYVSLIGFLVITNIGLGPLLMIIQVEYFPSHTRAKGGIITGIVAALTSFISIKQYQLVEDYCGLYMNFVIFAMISIFGTIIFSTILHETAGKSLGEIQKSLSVVINHNKQPY